MRLANYVLRPPSGPHDRVVGRGDTQPDLHYRQVRLQSGYTIPTATRTTPSHARNAQSARSYEGVEQPANPTAVRSRPRGVSNDSIA